MAFAFVCTQKGVEFDVVDHKLHRANKDKELHEELSNLWSADTGSDKYIYQLGGGCRTCATSSEVHIASHGNAVAAFHGQLTNLDELLRTFPQSHTTTTATTNTAGSGLLAEAAARGKLQPTNPAELICVMYEAVGVQLLALLQGEFNFCMYEAKTGRVLAARAGKSAAPLYQGMSSAESLIIGSDSRYLEGCHDIKEFQPGFFKYGWYAEPRLFSVTDLTAHHHGHVHANHHHGSSSTRKTGSGGRPINIARRSADVKPVAASAPSDNSGWTQVTNRRQVVDRPKGRPSYLPHPQPAARAGGGVKTAACAISGGSAFKLDVNASSYMPVGSV